MPQIYEYFGLVFRFYSDEHYPIHVHVEKGEYESIYDLIIVNGMLVELKLNIPVKKTKITKKL